MQCPMLCSERKIELARYILVSCSMSASRDELTLLSAGAVGSGMICRRGAPVHKVAELLNHLSL